jgi:predicted RNA-binding protein
MKSFLKYIFQGKKNTPPKKVLDSFKYQFGNSVNIEWEKVQGEFEAIFYFDNIEQIARFSPDGKLQSLKKNLTIRNLSNEIADVAKSYGEVMNVIEIRQDNVLNFEIIYRDEALVRYSLLLDENGAVLNHNIL